MAKSDNRNSDRNSGTGRATGSSTPPKQPAGSHNGNTFAGGHITGAGGSRTVGKTGIKRYFAR